MSSKDPARPPFPCKINKRMQVRKQRKRDPRALRPSREDGVTINHGRKRIHKEVGNVTCQMVKSSSVNIRPLLLRGLVLLLLAFWSVSCFPASHTGWRQKKKTCGGGGMETMSPSQPLLQQPGHKGRGHSQHNSSCGDWSHAWPLSVTITPHTQRSSAQSLTLAHVAFL